MVIRRLWEKKPRKRCYKLLIVISLPFFDSPKVGNLRALSLCFRFGKISFAGAKILWISLIVQTVFSSFVSIVQGRNFTWKYAKPARCADPYASKRWQSWICERFTYIGNCPMRWYIFLVSQRHERWSRFSILGRAGISYFVLVLRRSRNVLSKTGAVRFRGWY